MRIPSHAVLAVDIQPPKTVADSSARDILAYGQFIMCRLDPSRATGPWRLTGWWWKLSMSCRVRLTCSPAVKPKPAAGNEKTVSNFLTLSSLLVFNFVTIIAHHIPCLFAFILWIYSVYTSSRSTVLFLVSSRGSIRRIQSLFS